jgi:hypothetical protein
MKEFIDETSVSDGTPINRANLMALQGFQAKTTIVSADGKTIVETNGDGHTLTTTITDTQIVEVFVGEKTITKTTNISSGKYMEVIS